MQRGKDDQRLRIPHAFLPFRHRVGEWEPSEIPAVLATNSIGFNLNPVLGGNSSKITKQHKTEANPP